MIEGRLQNVEITQCGIFWPERGIFKMLSIQVAVVVVVVVV